MSPEQYRPSGFKLLPDVVKNLLILNGLFFIATYLFEIRGIDLTDILGLHNFSSEKFRPYQFVTYMFMHGNIWHIVLNMFPLWMFGSTIENLWGPKKFLLYYIITGLGAAIVYLGYLAFQNLQITDAYQHFLTHPTPEEYISLIKNHFAGFYEMPSNFEQINNFAQQWSGSINDPGYLNHAVKDIDQLFKLKNDIPMVGASGAVFGLLLAYGMTFPNSLLYVYFAIPIKAKYFVIIYGLIELFSGVANVSGDNVAHFAHLGGLFFGFLLIMFWRYQRWRKNKFFR
jgi:membrane associated rhomboid family serine protease